MTYVTGAAVAQGPGWWLASDYKWYPPELHPDFGKVLPTTPLAMLASKPELTSPAAPKTKPEASITSIQKNHAEPETSTGGSAAESSGSRSGKSALYETELPLGSHLVLLGGASTDAGFSSPVSAGAFRLPSPDRVKELVAEFLARTGRKQRMILLAIAGGAVVAENIAAMLFHTGVPH